jgi:hypothetical protein
MRNNGIVEADEPDQNQSHFAKPRPPLQERSSVKKRMKISTIAVY